MCRHLLAILPPGLLLALWPLSYLRGAYVSADLRGDYTHVDCDRGRVYVFWCPQSIVGSQPTVELKTYHPSALACRMFDAESRWHFGGFSRGNFWGIDYFSVPLWALAIPTGGLSALLWRRGRPRQRRGFPVGVAQMPARQAQSRQA